MKIISKFHDYYDSCMAFGHDDSVVYLREHLTFSGRLLDREVPPIVVELRKQFDAVSKSYTADQDWLMNRWGDRFPNHFRGKEHSIDLSAVRIFFCGKHYPAIRCNVRPLGTMHPEQVDFFYDADDLLNHIRSFGVDGKVKRKWSKQDDFDNIKDWFKNNAARQPSYDWMVANKATCVVQDNDGVHINAPLRDYQFYRKLDAYTTYQEIDMWISGTLAYPQNMMVEIDDKYRIMAHGFDMKYGFRTRPKK